MKKAGLVVIGILALAALAQFAMLLTGKRPSPPSNLAPPDSDSGTAPSPSDRVSIQVVSDADGAPPIEGARIEGMGPSGPIRERTRADGRATLPRGGPHRLRIQAARFVGLHLPVDLSVSDQTIVLKRTGSAKFTAVGADGKPVEGVTIRLSVTHHEPSFLLPGQEPEKTTGSDGIAQWEELAPGSKCEWTIASGHPVHPGEGIEHGGSKAVQLEDGRWAMQSGGATPFQAKGKFAVAGGEEFAITLNVRRTSTVLCRLGIGPDAAGTARVELWNKGEIPTPSGTYKDHRPERQVDVGVGAAISIPLLTPGQKYLRAAWWDAPGKRAYARLNFDLNEGETKDLGTLPRITGGTLELKVVLQGPAEAIERVEKPARASVLVSSHSAANDDLTVFDTFETEVGTPITITGLNGPRAFVTVMPGIKFRPGSSVVESRQPPPREIALPASEPIEVEVQLEIKHPTRITFSIPAHEDRVFYEGLLIPGGDDAIKIGGTGPAPGSTQARLDANLPPGEYRLMLCSRGELNLFATGTVTVRADGTTDVQLGDFKPGAVLRGRAVTKMGSPYKNPVYFRLADVRGNHTAYWAEPDAEGRFMIGGIVPKSKLSPMFFSPAEIIVGEAGSETWIDLTGKD